jgi:hypothetical protein
MSGTVSFLKGLVNIEENNLKNLKQFVSELSDNAFLI